MATPNYSFPSSTATISWLNATGNTMVRVYSSDGYNVTEQQWDGSSWTPTGFKEAGSAVSATCQILSGQTWIRVYCTAKGQTVEYCCDDGATWYKGSYPSPGN